MSEKLEKGAIRRMFGRYNRDEPAEVKTRQVLDAWQHTAAPREAVVATAEDPRPHGQNEKMRSLNKLAARTKMRRNPATGEREFLLHRGMGATEQKMPNDYQTVTSWTPSYDTAHRFAIDNAPIEEVRAHEPPALMELAHARVKSAWIPEKHIAVVANQLNPKGAYSHEDEIIVKPHKLQIAHPNETAEARAGIHGSGVPVAMRPTYPAEPEDRKAALRFKHQSRLKRAMGRWTSLQKQDKPPAPSSVSGVGTQEPHGDYKGLKLRGTPAPTPADANQGVVLSGLEDRERRFPAHNLQVYHGLEMKSLIPHPGTASSQVLFAGKPGDTKPRAILKDSAIPQLSAEANPERNSYLLHPSFQKAHREAAYQKLADEVFHMGQYVPKTAVFRHPKTKEPWSAQELVPNAREVYTSDLEPLRHNGDLHKLAIMNTILGNHDRHENNILKDQQGKVKLIDHGLAFDYSHVTTDIIPHYAHHILDEHVPDSVHHWINEISGAKLGEHMHRMGAPTPIILKALARLEEAKRWSHFVRTAEQHGQKPKHGGIGYLLEKMRLHQMGNQYADPMLRELKTRQIDEKIMGGSGVVGQPKGAYSSTIEQAPSRGGTLKRPA